MMETGLVLEKSRDPVARKKEPQRVRCQGETIALMKKSVPGVEPTDEKKAEWRGGKSGVKFHRKKKTRPAGNKGAFTTKDQKKIKIKKKKTQRKKTHASYFISDISY